MKKLLLAFSVFVGSYNIYSQNIPCPSIQPGIGTGGTNTICSGQCVPLTASVVTNNQTTNYSVAAIPYSPYGYTGTAVLNGNDDQYADSIPIGFPFCFFGTAYNEICIGSNGNICFDMAAVYGGGMYNNYQITTALPNTTDVLASTICAAFRDIDCALGGQILYQYVGATPCRALVISWVNVPLFDNGGGICNGTPNSTFQLVLYENTNYIDVYIENSFSCNAWNGGYGECGLVDPTGVIGVVAPGWNYPATPTGNNIAFRYSPTGPPSYIVTWTAPSGVVGTGLNINVCPTTTTTYTATMVVTNCNGSTLTLSDTVNIFVTPGAPITVNSPTICAGSTATLTAAGAATYTWSANAGSATTNTVSVTPATTTVYTVTSGAGGGGCAPIAQATVTVVPSLSVTVNVPPTICSGATTTLTATGATNYSWTPNTGLSATNTASVTANPNTTTAYTVVGSSGNCPPAIATTTVTVTPSTTITVNSATICPTSSATLTANGSATYNWAPNTGLSGTTGATVIANPATTTVYTVTGGNCVTQGTCTVTVVPTCSITVNSATICPNASATLTANGGGPYTWTPPTGLSATVGASVTASPPTTTVYTVTSTTGGFSVTATSTVVVNPVPTVSANNVTICQGATSTLIANGASTYTWTPPTGLSATTASTVAASPTVTTTYTVTGTSVLGCTNTAVATVGVNPMPSVSVTPTDSQGCSPLCVNYNGFSSTTTQTTLWNFGDGTTSQSISPTHCFNAKGTYSVSLTLTDANGCSGTAKSVVIVYPVPVAGIGASPQPTSILEPDIQFVDLSTNGPIATWNWNFGDYTTMADTSHTQNPKYHYQDTGTYVVKLVVITSHGCRDSTNEVIRIDDDYELFVPTAFSPNNDGLNEMFLPVGTGIATSNYHLYIYDRWGNLCFQTDNLYSGWNGTLKPGGNVVQEDVYVWKILLKTTAGVSKQIHGQVSVVK